MNELFYVWLGMSLGLKIGIAFGYFLTVLIFLISINFSQSQKIKKFNKYIRTHKLSQSYDNWLEVEKNKKKRIIL